MSAALSKVVGVSGDYSKLLVSQLRPALDAVTAGIKAMRAEGEQIPPDMLEQQFQLSSLVAQYKFAALSITTTLAPATEYYTDALGVQIPVIGGVHDAMGNLIGVNLRADGSFDALNVVLDTSTEKIGDVASVLSVLGKVFDDINSRMGQAAQVASKAWGIIGDKTTKRNPKFGQPGEPAEIATFSASQKWVAGLGAAAEATNLFVTGAGRAASAARGMMTGLASGAAIGTMIMPGIGTAIGAVGGAIAGLVSGWNSAGKAAREANREADKTLTQLRAGLVTTYGSIANVSMIGKVLGVDLAAAWGDTTVAGLEHFSKMVDEFEKKLQGLQSTLQKYGLTWIDMGGDIQRFFATKIGGDLVEEFNSMIGAGVDVNKVIKSMSASLNQYIIDSVKAGTKVPAAMEPIITKMIELGLVTDDAAKAMLGLGADTMPTLADITAAAERYGLSLDALGPKVQQLSINEAAAQIAKDWAILIAAGVDIGVILSSMNPEVRGMGEQVQELVSQAMKYGLELPSSMRPILQAMIDAGTLTDDTGKKLESLSGLTFAVDLTEMFEDLMKALKDLIATISGDVVPAVTSIGNARIPPIRIPYYYEDEGGGHGGTYGEDNSGSGGAAGMAGGGIVKPLYLAGGWAPMGSDTVPAMLTPGESVLTVAQTRAAGHTGGGTVVVKIDRRTLAELIVPVLPGVVREYSLG
jgi:gas vesicle protein